LAGLGNARLGKGRVCPARIARSAINGVHRSQPGRLENTEPAYHRARRALTASGLPALAALLACVFVDAGLETVDRSSRDPDGTQAFRMSARVVLDRGRTVTSRGRNCRA
jgi:hypothetical protein